MNDLDQNTEMIRIVKVSTRMAQHIRLAHFTTTRGVAVLYVRIQLGYVT